MSNEKTLTVGISTHIPRIEFALKMILPPQPDVQYLIIVQSGNSDTYDLKDYARDYLGDREDVTLVSSSGKGVTHSRNKVIELSDTEYLWFADDDLVFGPELFDDIKCGFLQNPNAAAITFGSLDGSGNPRKKFMEQSKRLSIVSSAKYATFEIAIRPQKIKKIDARFDTDFADKARFALGDEFIFLANIIRAGEEVIYVPLEGAMHPEASSGFRKSKYRAETEIKLLYRVFGIIGPLMWPILKIRQRISGHRTH